MELIDKAVVMSCIEDLLDKGRYHEEYECAYRDGNNGALYALKNKLNTLEAKEVDLEKEIDNVMKQYHMIAVGRRDFSNIAKHFFELRLKAKVE